MGALVEVKGTRELRRTMRAAGEDLGQLKDLNRKAADTVVSAASPPRKSGRLAGTVRAGATQRAGVVRAGRARVPYAGPIHWGWPKRNIAANPFLTEAARATEASWVGEYENGVNRILDKIKGA